MSTSPAPQRRAAPTALATWLLVALLAAVSVVGAGVALVLPLACGSAAHCDTGRVETGSVLGLAPLAATLVVVSMVRTRHRSGRPARSLPLLGLAVSLALLALAFWLIESGIQD